MKKRVVSGIQSSGDVHIGNYLGAMKRWADQQDAKENFYFIPNLHVLTVRSAAKGLRANTIKTVAWLLAVGIDTKKTTLFAQSLVPAHSELCWILNNYVTMGELSRMTQFKDKSQKAGPEGQLVGLFAYPVLQAADILLYDADEVPVGKDQVQHIELTRDIAARFNSLYGPVFKLPVPTVQEVGALIMNLQDPAKKMSKSDQDQSGVIALIQPVEQIKQKIKRAVTDSGKEIKAAADKPALTNLLNIYSLFSGESVDDLEKRYKGKGYADFKSDLAELVAKEVGQLQARYQELVKDEKSLLETIEAGSTKAEVVASKKLKQVKAKLGLL